MAAAIVQALSDTDATAENPSKTYTLTGMSGVATTAGNALIALVACNTKTRTISSISDSATNTWSEIDGGGSSTSGYADMWWSPGAASITSLVLHMSGTSKTDLILYEVSGLAGTVNAHHSTQNTTASTSASDSVTATGTGGLLIIAAIGATAAASSVAAPFGIDASAGGIGINLVSASAMQTGAGTYTATFTQTSQTSATTIAAFDVAGGGGGGVTIRELALLGVGS